MHYSGRGDKHELIDFLLSEAEKPFSGWDFGYISGTRRMMEAPLSRSYASRILPYLRSSRALLDLGTGGGEFLPSLQPLPDVACATEGYAPNVPIARQRLEPLGVTVYQIADERILPFDDEQFDLVIDRHEAIRAQRSAEYWSRAVASSPSRWEKSITMRTFAIRWVIRDRISATGSYTRLVRSSGSTTSRFWKTGKSHTTSDSTMWEP